MKAITIIGILAISIPIIAGAPYENDPAHIHGENGWWVPQTEDLKTNSWVDMKEWEDNFDKQQIVQPSILCPVHFYLYTKGNPVKAQQIYDNKDSVANSNFNPSHPTRFVIHGWTQSSSSGMNKKIRDAWLSKGNFNVIIVDWARARSVDYATSVLAIPEVGQKIAGMIDFLHYIHGMPLNQLFVIGHSLGAHVAGYTGKNVKSGKVQAIYGLDTALPLFSYKKPHKRLSSSDAIYVESIHTNGGQLGFLEPIGKASFYPNGGKSQPGCFMDLTGACSHGRSTTFYAEAVQKNSFASVKCNDYKDAVRDTCGSTYSSVRMGNDKNVLTSDGAYFVPVKSNSPYGMS